MPFSKHRSSIVRSHFLSCSEIWNRSRRNSKSNSVAEKKSKKIFDSLTIEAELKGTVLEITVDLNSPQTIVSLSIVEHQSVRL